MSKSVLNSQPKVAIIVLNWNFWQDTIECLESIQKLTYSNYRIILVDNGSANDSVEKIKKWCEGKISVEANQLKISLKLKHVEYVEYDEGTAENGGIRPKESELEKHPSSETLVIIQAEKNLGFSEGNNLAFRYALSCSRPADYVFLLNNDVWVDPECISKAVEVSEKKDSGVVGSVIKNIDGREIMFSGDRRSPNLFYWRNLHSNNNLRDDEPSNMVWGTAMLIHKNVLNAHERYFGYVLNPRYFLYIEDNEFCMKTKKLGYQIYIAKKSVVFHKHTQSCVNQIFQESLIHYYLTRNMIFLANDMLSGFWLVLFHVYHWTARVKEIVWKLVVGKNNEATAIFEGLLDGYRNVSGKWRRQP